MKPNSQKGLTDLKRLFNYRTLTLFRMGLFGVAHGSGGKKAPLSKISQTYSTMMKLGTVKPYLKKV